jgi:hypothetical protein
MQLVRYYACPSWDRGWARAHTLPNCLFIGQLERSGSPIFHLSPQPERGGPAIPCLLLLRGAGAGDDSLAGCISAAVLRRDFLPSRLEHERAQCEREDQHCDREQALAVAINAALHRRFGLLERRKFPRPILLPCSKHVHPPFATTRRESRATEASCANRGECLALPASPLTRSSRMPEQTSPPSRRCRTSG